MHFILLLVNFTSAFSHASNLLFKYSSVTTPWSSQILNTKLIQSLGHYQRKYLLRVYSCVSFVEVITNCFWESRFGTFLILVYVFQKFHTMPRLILNTNTKKENVDNLSKAEWLKITVSTGFLIFVYFIFSIGLTFYQRWFLNVCIILHYQECSVLFLISYFVAEI